jgi:predicted nucleotidyltransferase
VFKKLLSRISKDLEKRKIPYMIIGGQAVLLYGEPRLTKDIDITLGINPEKLSEIESLSKKLNLRILVEKPKEFVKKTMVLPVEEEKTGISIDFIFSFSKYEKQAIKRANSVKMLDTHVKFASLEDIIIHKIIAGRARDLEDVETILLKNPEYDEKYIKKWLEKFDNSLRKNFSKTFSKISKSSR